MTKEELRKIYSAYLPYKLHVLHTEKNMRLIISGVYFKENNDEYLQLQLLNWDRTVKTSEVKPILYDLSYLTKEELRSAGFSDHVDYLTHERESLVEKYGFINYINKLPYAHFQYLVSQHYNVFDLEESEFINKATLNK
jgi:hypothetical protein